MITLYIRPVSWLIGRLVGVTINFPFPNDSSFSFSGLLLLRGPNILLHQIFSSFFFSPFLSSPQKDIFLLHCSSLGLVNEMSSYKLTNTTPPVDQLSWPHNQLNWPTQKTNFTDLAHLLAGPTWPNWPTLLIKIAALLTNLTGQPCWSTQLTNLADHLDWLT